MDFEQNLFISYAHLDDQPLTSEKDGWITRFHADLKAFLDSRIGRTAIIWRDNKLQGNDVFSDEIVARFKQSAALLSIVTPRYLNSEWCTREAREFCQAAQQTGGLVVGTKSRLFKVIKTPVDPAEAESLPAPMKDLLGYEFFTYNEHGAPVEFDPEFGREYAQRYKLSIATLAHEIAQLLKTLRTSGSQTPPPGKPGVYLAECSYDRKRERDLVGAELKRLGYPVLPDQCLPRDEAEYVAAVEGSLARSALSIHFVGERYGAVPDGPSGKSTGVIQNELAVARCRKDVLKRLIWLPQGTRSEQTPQQTFIDALHQNAESQFGADLIAGGIEELRGAIRDALRKIEQPVPKQLADAAASEEVPTGEGSKLIYVIFDKQDRKATVPVRKWCENRGFTVAKPVFDDDASRVRKANQELLASCDAVLVYYGAGDEAWKRAIDSELKKMAGYRGGKPLPPVYTYLAEPRTDDKEDLIDMGKSGLIDGLSDFPERALAEAIPAVPVAPAPE